jgi:hypothetical protein
VFLDILVTLFLHICVKAGLTFGIKNNYVVLYSKEFEGRDAATINGNFPIPVSGKQPDPELSI